MKITRVTTKMQVRFGAENSRNRFDEKETPGVQFLVEPPYIWIGWKGEWKGFAPQDTFVEGEPEKKPEPASKK